MKPVKIIYHSSALGLLVFFFFYAVIGSAQQFPNLNFTQLNTQNGLSSNLVRCIFQDSRGLMWIGTDVGLNRYDGNAFKIFRNNPSDTASICNNDIRWIVEDREKNLWLGTAYGLCRFNPFTEQSVNFYHDEKDTNSLAANYEAIPFVDSKKRLWLATYAGVQLFDYNKKIFSTYKMTALPNKGWVNSYNYFHHISEDADHRLWAASHVGLHLIDEKNRALIPYYSGELISNLSFYQDAAKVNWIGQWGGGIKKFFPETNAWQQYNSFSKIICFNISEWKDNSGYSWLCAAMDGGLVLIDRASGTNKFYSYDKLNPQSLQANVVTQLLKDRDNRLWLATDQGVSIIDPMLQHFRNIRLYQGMHIDNPRIMGSVKELLETEDQYLVVPWYNKGYYVYSKNWELEKRIERIPPSSKSIYSGSVNFITDDAHGNRWYCTDSGLVKQTGNRFKVFTIPSHGPVSMERGDYFTRNIIQRKDGLFWVRAPNTGVLLFDPVKEIFIKEYKPGNLPPNTSILCIRAHTDTDIWAGCENGLYRLDDKTDQFIEVPLISNQTKQQIHTQVYDIFFDNADTWITTALGLAKVNASGKNATLINESLAGKYGMALKILPDRSGHLWISTSRGLLRYDKKNSFIFYNQLNGLPYDYFEGSMLFSVNKAGDFLMGSLGIVTVFNPATFGTAVNRPVIIFPDISSGNQRKQLDTLNNKYGVILGPGEKNLNVHFSVLNYSASVHNKYYYKLSGNDSAWYEALNGNISFSSLSPGSYILTAMGTNENGIFDRVEQQLYITVRPYWYQTAWFKLLCILVLILVAWAFFKWRIRSVKQESSFKQKIAETEMQALRAQMNPHFIFNSLNSIENFIMQNEKKLASDYLNKFSRLVRSILDSSLNEEVPVAKDMESLQLYIDLEQLRFSNKFSYHADIDPVLLNGDYKVPSLLVQPYVENAIVHGIAHSDKKELHLKLTATLENDYIKYLVEDNGIGRKKASGYNLQNKPRHKSVGLKITAERINLYNQKLNAGSEVIITDLFDDDNEAAGTRIEIKIKVI